MGDFQKLSGRPKLITGRRTKKIDVRFTEDEFDQILALETTLGITKTDLIRIRLLENAPQTVVNAAELIKHLDGIGAEMGRIGNNINQLARHANILNLNGELSPSVIDQFHALLDDYIKIQAALETSLRKIIRAMTI